MANEEKCNCKIPKIDYYGVLSLNRDCNDLDIKKAFRKLAIEFNPERQQDEKLKNSFLLVAEAYEILADPKTRLMYDYFGEEGLRKGIPGPDGCIESFVYHGDPVKTYRNFFGTENPYADILDISKNIDLLDECMKPRDNRSKEPPVIKTLYLTLEEVFFGGLKKMNIPKCVLSPDYENKVMMLNKIVLVPIKPGIISGTKIVIPGEVDEASCKIPADIIFVTKDRPHETFKRDGANLFMTVKVTLEESLLGTVITINTIDGRVIRTKITSIIKPDYKKVLPSEGLPLVENSRERGDLTISFNIEFPLYLNVSSKDDIKRAFTSTLHNTATDDNEYIHRFLLHDKMRKYVDSSNQITLS